MWIRGYFSKSNRDREQKRLGNTAVGSIVVIISASYDINTIADYSSYRI